MKKISAIPLVFIILLICAAALPVWFPSMKGLLNVVEYGLSWPVLISVLIGSFILLFEDPIRKFLVEFKDIEAKGIKLSRQQDKDERTDLLPSKAVSDLILQRDYEWQQALETERQAASASIEQVTEGVKAYVEHLGYESIKWRFRYADLHLVHRTKLVLKWFIESGPFDASTFDSMLKSVISEDSERNAIMNALLEVQFVEFSDDKIQATEFGKAYLEYLKNIGYII